MKRRRSLRPGGFTLLELLVALVVFGLLLVGLTAGVRTGLALWRAQNGRIGESADLDAGARLLRRLLSGMTMLAPQRSAAAATRVASGDAHRLVFVGDLPTGLGTTRLADMTLERQGTRLVLLWRPHRHERSPAPPPPPTDTELISGVAELDLAYWLPAAPGQPAAWRDRWNGPALPELVRVRLAPRKGDRRHWPDLIAAPHLSAVAPP